MLPGAYNLHNAATGPDGFTPPRMSGEKSHLFQPPKDTTNSESNSMILTRSTNSVMSLCSATTDGRFSSRFAPKKRTLADYNEPDEKAAYSTPQRGYTMEASNWGNGLDDYASPGWTPDSPQPFVNTRYQLAGGMDTPSMAAARAVEAEGDSIYADAAYRRSLGDTNQSSKDNATQRAIWAEHEGRSYFPDDFGHDANGRGRWSNGEDPNPRSAGWIKPALDVAGAVVGKVWEFCKSGVAFTGFRAGGGTGYKVDSSNMSHFEVAEHDPFGHEKRGSFGIPLPEQYPHEELEFIPDYIDRPRAPTPDSSPPRPAKRRQVSSNSTAVADSYDTPAVADELATNWVVVPPTALAPMPPRAPAQATPSRALPRPVARGPARYSLPTSASANRRNVMNSAVARPVSRASVASNISPRRPGFHASHSSRLSYSGPTLNLSHGASYASPRSSPTSKIPRPATPGRHVVGRHNGSAGGGLIRQSPLSSPASAEPDRWALMDAQLKAMIREGKEALGTKIEVEMEDDLDFRNGIGRAF